MTNDPSWSPGELPPDLLGRIPLFAELQKVLSWTGGPVNWDLARQIAVATAASQEQTHAIDESRKSELAEDARIAEMWIAQATPIAPAPSVRPVRAMTPAQWAEFACSAYRELIDPIAQKVSASMPGSVDASMLPPGIDPSMLTQAMTQMGPLLLGVQTGGVIGSAARNILGEHDLALPADDQGSIAILVPNMDRFSSAYALDPREVALWVTLHESAHRAVFDSIPGVRSQFWAAYLDYIATLNIDFSSLFEKLQGLDITNPLALESGEAGEGLFGIVDGTNQTPERLETLIAIIEALAHRIVEAAGAERLPASTRIAEAVARNEVEGGAGETLRSFVGVSIQDEPRRLADRFTRSVLDSTGWDPLRTMWEDSDLLPARSELSDPEGWTRRIHK
ncbi:MAG: zinc-dependent metalloprotease [Actinomycetota bacterium]